MDRYKCIIRHSKQIVMRAIMPNMSIEALARIRINGEQEGLEHEEQV
jgi:hypothetical protein